MSDVWFVRTQSGEARMTLDELDAAFQAGSIDEATQVREEGGEDWTTLGALLGGDTEPQASPPVVSVTPAPVSVAPPAFAPPVQSVRPVAVDLDDLDAAPLRPKKRGALVAAIAAGALVLVAVGVAATQGGPASDKGAAKAAAAGPAAAVVATPAPAKPDKADDPGAAQRLSDEQRKALDRQDKDLAAKRDAKSAELREKHQHEIDRRRPGTKSGPVFQKGGSKYDPLNTSL